MSPSLPARAVALLACPVCAAGLTEVGGALVCASGHSFDRAKQGHVTLLPPGGARHDGDSAAMVADRAAFLGAGHYAGVTEALAEAVLDAGEPETVLDLGGGTGQHLAGVLDRAPGAVGVVLDASRYAARRAARSHPRAMAVVADSWSRLPVGSASVDRVLVVFAPRNGAETARVLTPHGQLVVVTPAAAHLGELIGPLGLLSVDPDKTTRLADSLEPHLLPLSERRREDVLVLDRAAVATLVGMGPHARHLSVPELAEAVSRLPERVPVTVAVDVRTYGRR